MPLKLNLFEKLLARIIAFPDHELCLDFLLLDLLELLFVYPRVFLFCSGIVLLSTSI